MYITKKLKIFNWVIQISGIIQIWKEKTTPKFVEMTRLNENPVCSNIKIGRIKAVRKITGMGLKDSKLWVELSFKDNGNGDIK